MIEINGGNGERPHIAAMTERPSVEGDGAVTPRWRGVLALSTLFMLAFAGYALMFIAIGLYNGGS